jgi:hypothetical protein
MHKGYKTQQPPHCFPHSTLFLPPLLVPPLPISQISKSSLITLPSQLPLFIDIITKGFSIYYVNNCSGIEPINVIGKLHLQARDRKSTSTSLITKSFTTQKLNQGKGNRQLKPPISLQRT